MDISGNSCRLRSSGVSRSPHPTNCAPINHANSRANNIRPHCICFIYCFEQNKTNPSVYASRIQLPYRGAKIDSATNPNLSIRFMYARSYINVFYHDIILRKNFFCRAVKSQIRAFYILHVLCKQPKIKKQ